MKRIWEDLAIDVNARFETLGRAKGRFKTHDELARFLALAIAGEAGELANLFKKQWRGDDVPLADILAEIADVQIYLSHLARHLGADLDEICELKLKEVAERLDVKEAESQGYEPDAPEGYHDEPDPGPRMIDGIVS